MSGRTSHGRVRRRLWGWRWRRNPLRRQEDIVEAWAILVMWVVIVVGGALVGTVAARAAGQELARQHTDRQPVRAVLLTTAPEITSAGDVTYRAPVTVRWTGPDGSVRTGQSLVSTDLPAGATVTVWQDGRGRLTTEPPGPTEATAQAALFGTSAALVLGGLVYGTTALVRRRLDRRRRDLWGAEWDRVGPRWNQRTG
ncbi:Rv1733c family protein [Streptomyces sp. NPDC004069]